MLCFIDPRGVPMLDESPSLDPGDHDLSKLKFSLSGLAEIRRGSTAFR